MRCLLSVWEGSGLIAAPGGPDIVLLGVGLRGGGSVCLVFRRILVRGDGDDEGDGGVMVKASRRISSCGWQSLGVWDAGVLLVGLSEPAAVAVDTGSMGLLCVCLCRWAWNLGVDARADR